MSCSLQVAELEFERRVCDSKVHALAPCTMLPFILHVCHLGTQLEILPIGRDSLVEGDVSNILCDLTFSVLTKHNSYCSLNIFLSTQSH